MTVTIAEGVVEVTADGSGIPRQIARDIDNNQGVIDDAGRRSGGLFSSVLGGSFLGNFLSNTANQIVGAVGYAVGAGLRSAVEWGFAGIDMASDLQETSSAVSTVFGPEAFAAIDAWASQGAEVLGQTKQQALGAAQQFGVFANAAGLAGQGAADFSIPLANLATDLSSFYNVPVDQAIEAIGAGLRGEAEPLRQFGILMDDASLKAQAMAMGIYDGEGPLTQQQRTLAAQAQILASAGAAAGDFERTSGGLANQQRILAANVAEAQTALGTALLPVMLELTDFANTTLVPILDDLIEQIGPQLGQALSDAAPAFLDMIEAIVPYIPDLISFASEALPAVLDAITGFSIAAIEIGNFITDASDAYLAFNDTVGVVSDAISSFFSDLFGKFAGGWEQISGFFTSVGDAYMQFNGWLGEAQAWVANFFGDIGAKFAGGWAQISSFFQSVWGAYLAFNGWLGEAQAWVANFFGQLGGAIQGGINAFFSFAGQVGSAIGQAIGAVGRLPGEVMGFFGGIGSWLYNAGADLIGGFVDGIQSMIGAVGDAIGGVLDWASGFFPHSPAKRGPFSGAGWTALHQSGDAIFTQFTSGFGRPDLTGALTPILAGMGGTSSSPARTIGETFAARSQRASGASVAVDLTVKSEDPTIAGRQFARSLTDYMGV